MTGPTVEAAIKKGLAQLGVGPSQVIVEVLDEPVRGLFGIGARQARVRLQPLVPVESASSQTTAPVEASSPAEAEAMPKPVEEVETDEPPQATDPQPTPPEAVEADEPPQAADPQPTPPEAVDEADNEDTDVSEQSPEPETVAEEVSPAEAPVAVEPETPRAKSRSAESGTYDDDDFFDDEGNFVHEVEVLRRRPKSAEGGPRSDSYFRRLSFAKPKPEKTEDDETVPAAKAEDKAKPPSTPEPKPESSSVADTPVASDEDDEVEEAEEENIPIVNLRKRGPARFENFERRGRRYDEMSDDDDDEDDADVTAETVPDDTTDEDATEPAPPPAQAVVASTGAEVEADNDRTLAEKTLAEMMDVMGLDMAVEVAHSQPEDGNSNQPWILNLRGEAAIGDALTGQNGETLSALQFLTRLIVSKQTSERANIVVDVNDHRLRRTDKLADLANRLADEAIENGRKVSMDPMPSHERRIVHMILRRRGDVKTDSVGKGDKRRVTIIPKTDDTD